VAVDPTAAQDLVQKSGQMGVPVITAGNEVIVGFDRPRLEELARRYAAPSPPTDPSTRPKIGLRVKDTSGGAEVAAVHPGSPAEQGGVRVGDVVVELNGRSVRSAADLEAALATLEPGGTVAVEVRRSPRQTRLRIPL
jgi:predicted metalloprotease with PDZ domain